MFAIAPGTSITEFDAAPAGRYLLSTPRGRFVLSRSAVDLIRSLEGKSSVEDLRRPPAEQEALSRFVREQVLPTGVFGDGELPERREHSLATYVHGARPFFSVEAVRRWTGALRFLFQPALAPALTVLSVSVQLVLFWTHRSLRLEDLSVEAYAIGGFLCLLTLPFHELGHGAACRYYGVEHGPMGFALYYIFPCFYTDTSDAWRLKRGQRVMVDLGGIYFQLLAAGVFSTLYLLTGAAGWAAGVLMVDLSVVQNLKPYLRVDGYQILTDVAGVPAPYTRVKEYVRYLLAGRERKAHPAPTLAQIPGMLRWLVLGYVVFAGTVGGWVIATIVYKTITVVIPAYPHALARLASSPWISWAFARSVMQACGQTLLIAALCVFISSSVQRLLRWGRALRPSPPPGTASSFVGFR